MRYTRNRQLIKLGIDGDLNNIRIDEKRNPNSFWFNWHNLDPTFKWHRDFHGMNIVSFNRKDESFKTYVIKGRK
ncbi:hypothetical protein [Bacillus thuringiensis]|uniref:hypothetical protein n=1 Tax=Bacillus thuringiensis TaxID=1428 RepID=UPI000BFC0C30|nr:hypothetical protein [Bacillus thuringiensis]PGM38525.1 hypothetical protein CN945_01275 [Bacillus thuringiensis]